MMKYEIKIKFKAGSEVTTIVNAIDEDEAKERLHLQFDAAGIFIIIYILPVLKERLKNENTHKL